MKRFLGSAAVVVISFAAAFLAGELAVRLLLKEQSVLFPRYHADYRYGRYTLRGIRPNAHFWHTSADGSWRFDTNSRGLRDRREFPYEKPAGTLRILSVGDSMTQGYEVRQDATFSAVLERYLGNRGVRAEVLNAGVSGFSTAEELAFLENEGYKYRPDFVVLGFFANDFEDNLKAGLFSLENGRLAEVKYEHLPGVRIQNVIYAIPGVKWLGENSYLYSLLFNGVWEHFKAMLAARTAHAASAARPSGDAQFEYAVAARDRYVEGEVELAVALVERMQRFCDEHGMTLLVVDIPQRPGPYRFAPSFPEEAMAALRARRVEVVASSSLLADYQGSIELHVAHGHHHISEFTHAMIGAELGRRVMRRLGPQAAGDRPARAD